MAQAIIGNVSAKHTVLNVKAKTLSAYLTHYDTVFLVDDSATITYGEWVDIREALVDIASEAARFDADGVSVHFVNDPSCVLNTKDTDLIKKVFSRVQPKGLANVSYKLRHLIDEHNKRSLAAQAIGQKELYDIKPLNIVVLTDGDFTEEPYEILEAIRPGLAVSREIKNPQNVQRRIGIQFVQVGDDAEATEALESLDNALPADEDAIDTVRWEGTLTAERLFKILLGAVYNRLDKTEEPHLSRGSIVGGGNVSTQFADQSTSRSTISSSFSNINNDFTYASGLQQTNDASHVGGFVRYSPPRAGNLQLGSDPAGVPHPLRPYSPDSPRIVVGSPLIAGQSTINPAGLHSTAAVSTSHQLHSEVFVQRQQQRVATPVYNSPGGISRSAGSIGGGSISANEFNPPATSTNEIALWIPAGKIAFVTAKANAWLRQRASVITHPTRLGYPKVFEGNGDAKELLVDGHSGGATIAPGDVWLIISTEYLPATEEGENKWRPSTVKLLSDDGTVYKIGSDDGGVSGKKDWDFNDLVVTVNLAWSN